MNSKNTAGGFFSEMYHRNYSFMATGVLFKSCSNAGTEKPGAAVTGSSSSPAPCSDYNGLTETDLKARQSMGYVQQSPLSDEAV